MSEFLSPQILTILFIALALAVKINANLYFYKGPLHILFYLLYVLHLTVSYGDFYGIMLTLAKAKLKGKLNP